MNVSSFFQGSALKLSLPTVADDMQDTVSLAYKAWPERIYVLDAERKVAYRSAIGPFGFKPNEAAKALAALLAPSPTPTDKHEKK